VSYFQSATSLGLLKVFILPKRHSLSASKTTLTNNSNLHGTKSATLSPKTNTSSQQPSGTPDTEYGNLSSTSHLKKSENPCR
jgi:hypothetical protein